MAAAATSSNDDDDDDDCCCWPCCPWLPLLLRALSVQSAAAASARHWWLLPRPVPRLLLLPMLRCVKRLGGQPIIPLHTPLCANQADGGGRSTPRLHAYVKATTPQCKRLTGYSAAAGAPGGPQRRLDSRQRARPFLLPDSVVVVGQGCQCVSGKESRVFQEARTRLNRRGVGKSWARGVVLLAVCLIGYAHQPHTAKASSSQSRRTHTLCRSIDRSYGVMCNRSIDRLID